MKERHNNAGMTALAVAVDGNHLAAVAALLDGGCDIDAKTTAGASVLHIAAENAGHNAALLRLLVERGCPVNLPDAKKGTPLLYAAMRGQTEVVHTLLTLGANVDARNRAGYTPLLYASNRNQLETIPVLLQAGADIEAVREGWEGWTPLLTAAAKGKLELVRLLADHGADVNVQDNQDNRPLDLAVQFGYLEVVQTLVVWGARRAAIDRDQAALPMMSSNGIAGSREMEKRRTVKWISFFSKLTPVHAAIGLRDRVAVRRLMRHGGSLEWGNGRPSLLEMGQMAPGKYPEGKKVNPEVLAILRLTVQKQWTVEMHQYTDRAWRKHVRLLFCVRQRLSSPLCWHHVVGPVELWLKIIRAHWSLRRRPASADGYPGTDDDSE